MDSGKALRTIAPWAAMLGAWAAFFHRATVGGEYFFARDAARLHAPLKAWAGERLRQGELPLWFPFEGLGRPFVDLTVSGLFHPFTLVFVVFDGPTALNLCTLACYPFALGGFWLLMQRWGAGPWVAALGSLCFAHCGYLVSMSDNLTFLFSICALPWLLFALDHALASGRLGPWLGVAGIEALVVLNGDLQDAYWFGMVALAYALTLSPGTRLRSFSKVGLALVAAALLAAVQVLPSWSLFAESDRVSAEGFYADALSWSVHPLRLLNALDHPQVIDLKDRQLPAEFFAGKKNGFWSRSIYFGPGLLALALCGVALEQRRLRRFLAGLALISLWLSFGALGGLYTLAFKVVPFWSAFRYPEKLFGLVSFAVVALATLALERIARRGPADPLPWRPAAAVGAVLALLTLVTGPGREAAADLGRWLYTGDHSGDPAGSWNRLATLWFEGGWPALLGLSLCGGLAWLWHQGKLKPSVALAGAAVLLFGDLARVNNRAYPTTYRMLYDYQPAWVSLLREREGTALGQFRIHTALGGMTALPLQQLQALGLHTSEGDVLAMKNALELEHNALYGIESSSTYLPGASPRLAPLLKQGIRPALLAAFNVKYSIAHASPHYEATLNPRPRVLDVIHPFDLALLEIPAVLSRARLVERWEAAPADEALIQRLLDPAFPWATTALVEGAAPAPDARAAQGTVKITEYRPERVALEVDADHPALLVLADAWHPAWKATLDGVAEVPVLRTNALARGVQVPAGKHTLVLTFEPRSVGVGAAISGLTLVLALVALARERFRLKASSSRL